MAKKKNKDELVYTVWVNNNDGLTEIPASSYSQGIQKAREMKAQSRVNSVPTRVYLVAEIP